MSTGTTALMPTDPTVSAQHAVRILPIRANLLPDEITSGRNVRRTRIVLVGAVALTALVMGGWYVLADKQRDLDAQDLASVTEQADTIRTSMRTNQDYLTITKVIDERDEITADLKTALAEDLPWSTLLGGMRSAATTKGGTLTSIVANLSEDTTSSTATDTIGTIQISGTAKDKATIADVLTAMEAVKGVDDVYLTAATGQSDAKWTFTLTASIDKGYVCGRYSTKTCGSK